MGLDKLEVGESPPISGSWAPPASGSWAGRYSPQHIWVVSLPPPPCPQAHLELWILTNLFVPHPHQHL